MRYDLTDLQLFAAIAACGNLTQGAERVHLAPASASARVRRLEEAAGAPLFERLPRGVALTPAGESMLRHARRVLSEVALLDAELGTFARGVAGVVRLFANTNAIGGSLPQDLAGFLAAQPQVDVLLEEHSSPAIVSAVVAGAADVGIVAGEVGGPDLAFLPYRADRLVLVCATDHPFAARGRLQFAETLSEHYVGLSADSAIHGFLLERAREAGRRPRIRAQVRAFEAVCRMVSAGVGVAVVPHSAALSASRAMPLALVELDDAWGSREMKLCFRRDQTLTRYQRELITHLTLIAQSGRSGA
ncbi:LysR family transcriptional regulator [Niveibacterium umoris]|uniref:DNA-binding transcriptional LysR family regulator n=1 Tax=Niveibacterium umoris TaxID=1193620 RepID=A0A840BNP3_9RHOO|nr:DNA-binding transcriptional LysR family regulator [Niveibacterium umoris]